MTINLTKTETPQTHLEAFLNTLPKDMLIRIAVGLNGDLNKAQIATAAAKQEVAALSQAISIAANRSDRDILSELEDGEVISYVAQCLPDYMVEALPHVAAMTKEFEEKYYGLDLQNRALEKHQKFLKGRIKHLEERFAVVTMRLAQAEAALGVFCNDEPSSNFS